jgi:ribosomal protein S8
MQRVCEMVQSLLKTDMQLQRSPYHPLTVQALQLLARHGLVRGFCIEGNRINIFLKNYSGAPVIQNVLVVSRPSRAIYLSPQEMTRRTAFNSGLWLISSKDLLLTHRECIELGHSGKVLIGVNVGSQKWV